MINYVTSVRGQDVVGNLHHSFVQTSHAYRYVRSIHTVRLSKIEYIEYKLSFHVQKDGGVFWKFWNEIRISGLESVQNFENLWLSKLLLVRKIGIFTYLGFGVTMMRGILYQSCTLCRLMFQSQPNGLLRLRFLITKPGTSKNV